ncbi:monovalent cation/H+ antiporter complex subunit F [Rhabdothermincola sp.]|uniref:monovalent cation/H+ antiporter complex subunit F n=1 Tax=Rhabdothermincola sp. TaxID=2820405 RepID=UPI002FE39A6F
MTLAANISFGLLVLAASLAVVRLVRGPSLADRIVATDLLITILVLGLAVEAARTNSGAFLSVMLVVAVLGFLGTTTVARFIERRGA